jgi:hypothetical protein
MVETADLVARGETVVEHLRQGQAARIDRVFERGVGRFLPLLAVARGEIELRQVVAEGGFPLAVGREIGVSALQHFGVAKNGLLSHT